MILLAPTITDVHGVTQKTFPAKAKGALFFGSFRSFGGTERVVDNVYVLEDTAVVETWFRPDIKADCRILVNDVPYNIIGTPENIEMRNQYLKFKVTAVRGGA